MIQNFLKTNKPRPHFRTPVPIEILVAPNHLIAPKSCFRYSPSYFTGEKWNELPHITQNRLPKLPKDIKGVDTSVYIPLNRKTGLKSCPTLLQTRFFALKYLPLNYDLCAARKSNIAYTFTNFQVSVLNSQSLAKQFSSYKGKYRHLPFFLTQPSPMGTAVTRSKYRKLVKRLLHDALLQTVSDNDVAKVSGVFVFRFQSVPTTEEEIQSVKNDLIRAVQKVYSDTAYQKSLQSFVHSQNSKAQLDGVRKNVQRENTIDAHKVADYVPKLPYLHGHTK